MHAFAVSVTVSVVSQIFLLPVSVMLVSGASMMLMVTPSDFFVQPQASVMVTLKVPFSVGYYFLVVAPAILFPPLSH